LERGLLLKTGTRYPEQEVPGVTVTMRFQGNASEPKNIRFYLKSKDLCVIQAFAHITTPDNNKYPKHTTGHFGIPEPAPCQQTSDHPWK
jgi:hypothetical protein